MCNLGDICDITSSKRIFASEYRLFGVPFFRGKEIIEKQAGKNVSTEIFIEEERYNDIAKRFGVPQEGDILLTSVGTLGIPYVVRDEKFYFKDGNLTWIKNFRETDSTYIYYWLLSPFGKAQIDQKCIGSTQKALTIDALLKFEIDLPDLETQRTVIATLRALDDKIENNTKINHNLEQQAQAIFKSWFVDNAPAEWEHTKLGSITTEIRTKVKERRIPVLSAVKTGELILSEEYFTKQVFSKDIGKYIVVEPSEFAYNPARVNIGSLGINSFDYAGCVSPVYVIFRSIPEYHNYLSFFFKSPNFQEEVKVRASGSVRQSLNYGDFSLIQVLLPSIEIIRIFNYQFEGFLSAKKRLSEENARLIELRDYLLPRLMSGELSVANI